MQLPSTYYPNNSRVVVGTPQIFTDDVILLCDTSLAPVTINLLEIPDDAWLTTYKLYIVDNSSNASVNNITINAGAGQLINDQTSVTISTNGQCALVRIVSNNQYISTSSGGVVANALEVLNEGVSITPNASSMNFVGDYVNATAVGSAVTVTIDAPDTGWVDLEGFEYQSAIGKPQCRKIGKQIHFRGAIIIPLSNDGGSTLIPIVNSNSYVSEWYNQVFTSTNGLNKGVTVNPDGTITFNLNSSVIPTSVLPALTNLDGTYLNQIIGTRPLSDKSNFGMCLSAFFQMIITTQKKLVIQTIIDFEQPSATAPNYLLGTMPLRFITSTIRQFDRVPDFTGATTYIQNGTGPTPYPLQSDWNLAGAGDYPVSIDAGQPNQIGGFVFRLDGLTAYI